MKSLVLCPECSRHVRQSEPTCPFCDASIQSRIAGLAPRALPTARLGRAALFAFAAASVGAAGCSSSTDDEGGNKNGASDAGTEDGAASSDGSDGSGGAPGTGGGKSSGGSPSPGPGAGGKAANGGAGAGGHANTGAGGLVAVPVYGAPFPIDDGGATDPTDATPTKDGGDGPGADGGIVPLYGGAAIYGAPPARG